MIEQDLRFSGVALGFVCVCMVGLTCLKVMCSSLLSSDVNECVENPCHNGATCNDRVGYFTCTCPPQFTGSRCEVGEWLSTDSVPILISSATARGDQHCCFYSVCTGAGLIERL